jgi:glycosyltransferase involved in cell wall biosynthesis
MEQVLGHTSHYHTLRSALERVPDLDARWVEVTYQGDGVIERLRPLPISVRSTLRGFTQVRAGLRHATPGALFFHTQKPAVFQWDWMARVPTVLSLDVTPRQYDELGQYYDHVPDGRSPLTHVKHAINVRTFGLAQRIVAWSTWVKDSLVADYGVPEWKVKVIPPGVDLDLWTPPITSAGSRELPRVLFVGGDFERKGGLLLLDWFRQHGRGRCELDIVTRAPLICEAGVRVHRSIVGNSEEARRLFFSSDVFVLPSLGECFGIASVEAMAAGLPVVTTRVGGSPDIVEHGVTGLLIAPGDGRALAAALNRLLVDADLRRSMGRRGRTRAERLFDGVVNAQAVLDCLRAATTAWGAELEPLMSRAAS